LIGWAANAFGALAKVPSKSNNPQVIKKIFLISTSSFLLMFLVWAPDAPSVGVAPEPDFVNEIASQLTVM
jgi:hypothetical protein